MDHLILDLNKIVISYMDTETYKIFKHIYPYLLKDSSIDQFNLLCNVPLDFLLKCAAHYVSTKEYLMSNLKGYKLDPIDLIAVELSTDYQNIIQKINENKVLYYSEDLILALLESNVKLRGKYNRFITDNDEDSYFEQNFMLEIRNEILRNEEHVSEITYPFDYIEIIEKYLIKKLEELGY
jgi:hypothetical protein